MDLGRFKRRTKDLLLIANQISLLTELLARVLNENSNRVQGELVVAKVLETHTIQSALRNIQANVFSPLSGPSKRDDHPQETHFYVVIRALLHHLEKIQAATIAPKTKALPADKHPFKTTALSEYFAQARTFPQTCIRTNQRKHRRGVLCSHHLLQPRNIDHPASNERC